MNLVELTEERLIGNGLTVEVSNEPDEDKNWLYFTVEVTYGPISERVTSQVKSSDYSSNDLSQHINDFTISPKFDEAVNFALNLMCRKVKWVLEECGISEAEVPMLGISGEAISLVRGTATKEVRAEGIKERHTWTTLGSQRQVDFYAAKRKLTKVGQAN